MSFWQKVGKYEYEYVYDVDSNCRFTGKGRYTGRHRFVG